MSPAFEPTASPVPRTGLGSTPFEVGRIGLGCMVLTGVYDVERRDERQAEAALNKALDLGMNYLDTADSFGPFGNEKLLGRTLARRSGEAVVATKVGLTGRSDGTHHHNGTPAHIRASVEDSLRRLRVDAIDVYQLQAVDPQVPVEESWGALADLVHHGKVRTIGIVSDDPGVLARVQRIFPVSVVSAELSYWQQRNLPLVRWTAARGIAFVPTAPLGRGFLTGSFSATRRFGWTDLRSKLPQFTPEMLRSAAGVLDPLRAVARQHAARPGQVALAWLLAQGPNVVPVPGSKDPVHVAQNAQAAQLRLTAHDLAVLGGPPVAADYADLREPADQSGASPVPPRRTGGLFD
jgi:aryl-alcohol dehydrogenase-like predicted oxidoreductase